MYDDIRNCLIDIKNNWNNIKKRYLYASSRFFYTKDFLDELVYNRNFKNLPKDDFINYQNAYLYYKEDRKKFTLTRNQKSKDIEIPYQELINYIHHPESTIDVKFTIDRYQMDNKLIEKTLKAYNEFLKQRPRTKNNPILRLKCLNNHQDNNYEVILESASYYDLVRTNLSLDFPLTDNSFKTLRIDELNENNCLKSFEESEMVNSIGVSTILTYHNKGSFYFFMKPRKAKLGVFNNMLGSISGVVEPPELSISELTNYIADEVIRELGEETGLSINKIKSNPQFQIIPLALTRELIRGGKPQFFFLIVIEKISDMDLRELFKKSEGTEEFKDDFWNNIKSYDDVISPEYSANLLYSYLYIQKTQKISTETILLG